MGWWAGPSSLRERGGIFEATGEVGPDAGAAMTGREAESGAKSGDLDADACLQELEAQGVHLGGGQVRPLETDLDTGRLESIEVMAESKPARERSWVRLFWDGRNMTEYVGVV